MTIEDKLELLRSELQNPPESRNNYLLHLLRVSEARIANEGIVLTDSVDDADLVVMYAAWRYRCRNKDNNAIPRMLRFALNNRLFRQKGAVTDAV